jgi:hypothetical protein
VSIRVRGPSGGGADVRLPAPLIANAVSGVVTRNPLLTILACQLVGQAGHQPGGDHHPIGLGRPDMDAIREAVRRFRRPPRHDRIERELVGGRNILLTGKSGSGKTTTACVLAAQRHAEGDGLIWLRMTDPNDSDETVIMTLLTSPRRSRYLLVIDDIQANISAARDAIKLASRLRASFRLEVTVLATAWLKPDWLTPDVVGSEFPRDLRTFNTDGVAVARLLVDRPTIQETDRQEILRRAGGDLVLVTKMVAHVEDTGRVPTDAELADHVATESGVDEMTDTQVQQALYWFACLGVFEIIVTEGYARTFLTAPVLDELLSRRLIEPNDLSYTVGHRSLARLLIRYAERHWDDPGRPLEPPPRVAFKYLQVAGPRQTRATLERLDLISIASANSSGPGSYLADSWQAMIVLRKYLVQHAASDPRWSDNPFAAAFAAVALAQLDRHYESFACAAFVRASWTYDDDSTLPSPVGGPASELEDAQRLAAAMTEEDAALGAVPHRLGQAASEISIDRLYRTWMLGVLLWFEATAIDRDQARIDTLRAIARREQLPSGAFYPERMPGVTARVVLGLCEADEPMDSDVLARACGWLRIPPPRGAYQYGWKSGTGTWSTDEMTTAMCLSALLRSGLDTDDTVIVTGFEMLWQSKQSWTAAGREIDLALVLEAMLLGGHQHARNIYPQIMNLLGWAISSDFWSEGRPLTADEEENSKVTFIAAQIVSCVWQTVWRDLERLFEGLSGAVTTATSPPPNRSTTRPQGLPAVLVPSPASSDSEPARPNIPTALKEAVDKIRMRLQENIDDRERALPSLRGERRIARLRDNLEEYKAMMQQLEQLASTLSADTSPEVLRQLDELGRRVYDRAWTPLLAEGQ